jgi:hypothetical protein
MSNNKALSLIESINEKVESMLKGMEELNTRLTSVEETTKHSVDKRTTSEYKKMLMRLITKKRKDGVQGAEALFVVSKPLKPSIEQAIDDPDTLSQIWYIVDESSANLSPEERLQIDNVKLLRGKGNGKGKGSKPLNHHRSTPYQSSGKGRGKGKGKGTALLRLLGL